MRTFNLYKCEGICAAIGTHDWPRGQHATSVAGRGSAITRADLLRVAKAGGVKLLAAKACIDHWCGVAQTVEKVARELPIRRGTLGTLIEAVDSISKSIVQATK